MDHGVRLAINQHLSDIGVERDALDLGSLCRVIYRQHLVIGDDPLNIFPRCIVFEF